MPLNKSDISSVTAWDWIAKKGPRPVYKGIISNTKSLILKIEGWSGDPPSISGSKVDKNLYQVRVRRSVAVISELHSRVHISHKQGTTFPDMHLLGDEGIRIALESMMKLNDEAYRNALSYKAYPWNIWYLMEFIPNLNSLREVDEKMGTDEKNNVWETMGEEWFRSLGKIFAVDCFVGHLDRFRPYVEGKQVINLDNIFIADKDSVGIDFFDPSSIWKDFYSRAAVSEVEKGLYETWPGRFLEADRHEKLGAAQRCVRSIFDIFGKTINIKNHALALRDGIEVGADRLKAIVRDESSWAKINFQLDPQVAAVPPQLKLRADALGWK